MLKTRFLTTFCRAFSNFVPAHEPISKNQKNNFKEFLENYENILILTGAGVSTESGIPDYRSGDVGLFAKSSYKPILYSEFLKNKYLRTRYWARNYVGWPKFSMFGPNKVHYFVSELQNIYGKVTGLVTQNVDGLHSKAGSSNVVELHGNAYWVKCENCSDFMSRYDFQRILSEANPDWNVTAGDIRPDGDVDLDPEKVKNFVVPDCEKCGGLLKPTVVFFGDNVPPKRVKKVESLVESCDAMMVLGTSLSTLSSYRIVLQAYDLNKFICIVNIGPTRGDKMADLRIHAKCGDIVLWPHNSCRNKYYNNVLLHTK